MQIVACPEVDVPLDLRLQVVALQEQAWPSDGPTSAGTKHDPALRPRSMLLVEDGRVLAALDILSKLIGHRGALYAASGLSTVVSDPTRRGRGYGHRLVEAAREAMAAGGADLGIFTCDHPLQAFYERAGWQALTGSVLVGGTRDAPFPSDVLAKVVMACFFSRKAREAAGTFVGARIELYPGEIDKLW